MTISHSFAADQIHVLDCFSQWSDGGASQLQATLLEALSLVQHSDHSSLSAWLLCVVRCHSLSSQVDHVELASLFHRLSQESQHDLSSQTLQELILDSIWTIDAELESRSDLIDLTESASTPPDLSLQSDQPHPISLPAARSRLARLAQQLLLNGVLAQDDVCSRLDQNLLVLIGLISNDVFFNKRSIQLRTARLFKQQKFNLLREENEGYTALITQVVTNIGPPTLAARVDDPASQTAAPSLLDTMGIMHTIIEQEDPSDRNLRAETVMNNVQALIGYFDLDANRVLDIILDLFSTNLLRHYPFFLALLAVSPWGKEYHQHQQQQHAKTHLRLRPTSGSSSAFVNSSSSSSSFFAETDLDLSKDTGNRICAQLLGFKFAHYCHQDTKESVPEDLYLMTALLIKSGFLRFADIYSHLAPGDEGMKKLFTQHRQALAAKVSSARANALSMAAPLADESDGASGKKDAQQTNKEMPAREPPNQILGLLRAMLALGDVRHSLFVLTRYPWLCAAYNEVADPFIRLLKVILEPAYQAFSFLRQGSPLSEAFISEPKPRWDTRQQKPLRATPKSVAIVRRVPEPAPSANLQCVFFYPDWSSDLSCCHNLDDLLRRFVPLLKVLGVCLWRDVALLQKLCRLTKVGLQRAIESHDEEQRSDWLNILRYHLLPALSLSPSNSGLVSEIWELVVLLPYHDRFSLYGQWKNDLYQMPELRAAQAETEKEAKGILKRISKDNIKQSGRNLAKASHSNPTIFFTIALNQVQAYDNLIQPLVESAKYLSRFEYDIFSFNLVDALSNPEKERTKQDGTNISLWLKSLAAFCGTLFRRYAMDCTPIIQYLVNQLKANNSKDLVIVSELITKMSGIEPLANLADAQIAALTGGRSLHMEAMMAANALNGSKERLAYRRSGQRLLQALVESKLAVPLLVLVAQQRQACIHLVPESEAHLKYLGNLFDSCQEILLQYIEFLYNYLETAEYASSMPSLKELCVRFGIEPAIAFYIARPKLVHSMKQIEAAEAADKLRAELTASKDKLKKEEELITTDQDPQHVNGTATSAAKDDASTSAVEDADVEMEAAADPAPAAPTDGQTDGVNGSENAEKSEQIVSKADTASLHLEGATPARDPWHPGLLDAMDAAQSMLPESAQACLGSGFYVTFWQLSLSDVNVPIERYQQETKRLSQLIRETTLEEPRRRLQDTVNQLNAEMKDQMKSHELSRKRLMGEKDHWFGDGADRGALATQMIQYCLFPRALLSPTDAIFAGKFVRTVHSLGARNFSSLTTYDKIFVDHIAAVIFSATENEARNYSRFLYTVLADLSPWHKSLDTYNKEAIGQKLPGFQMRWHDRHGGEEIPKADLLTWEQFRLIFCKWQDCLQKAFRTCLTSREYMRIRNAIVIMTRIAPFFPLIDTQGQEMLTIVEDLGTNEQRGDLKILAQGLLATLKARKKFWVALHQARKVANPPPATSTEKADSPVLPPSKPEQKGIKKDPATVVRVSAQEGNRTRPREEQEVVPKSQAISAKRDAQVDDEKVATRESTTTKDSSKLNPSGPKISAPPTGPSSRNGLSSKIPPASANLPSRPGLPMHRSSASDSRPGRPVGASTARADEGRRDDRSQPLSDVEPSLKVQRRSNGERSTPSAPEAKVRPEGTRSPRESALPSRPSRDATPASLFDREREQERRASGVTSDAEKRPPQGPRRDRDSKDSGTSVARQLATDSMNPPVGPAKTSGAQISRSQTDRERSDRSTPSADRDREREKEKEKERARRERERGSRDSVTAVDDRERNRDRDERQRDRERERDRTNPRDRDRDRDREGERDRDRSSKGRDRERDDRRRSSAHTSRNGTPVAEASDVSKSSGPNRSLGARRDNGREPTGRDLRDRDRDRESGSSRATPAPASDAEPRVSGSDSRKRTLVDRLGASGSSGASAMVASDQAMEDPSKRIKIDRNQKYASAPAPVPSKASPQSPYPQGTTGAETPRQASRNSYHQHSTQGSRRDHRVDRRDRSARRAGNE